MWDCQTELLATLEHDWCAAWEAGALKRTANAISATHILKISGESFRRFISLSPVVLGNKLPLHDTLALIFIKWGSEICEESVSDH